MVLCLENAILSWHGTVLQAQGAAVPEQADAPAIVLHIGELPAQVQLSRRDVAALSLQALADIWRVGLPKTSSPVCFHMLCAHAASCHGSGGPVAALRSRQFVAVKNEGE